MILSAFFWSATLELCPVILIEFIFWISSKIKASKHLIQSSINNAITLVKMNRSKLKAIANSNYLSLWSTRTEHEKKDESATKVKLNVSFFIVCYYCSFQITPITKKKREIIVFNFGSWFIFRVPLWTQRASKRVRGSWFWFIFWIYINSLTILTSFH